MNKIAIARGATWLAAAAWLIVMFALAAQSGESSAELSEGFSNLIGKLLGIDDVNTLNAITRKLAHFGGFFIEGALARLAVRMTWRGACDTELTLIAGAALCALNEATQLFAPGRGFSTIDMCIDFSGFALGACALSLVITLFRRRAITTTQN